MQICKIVYTVFKYTTYFYKIAFSVKKGLYKPISAIYNYLHE